MGIEKLLPKPSSFLPGGLAINVTDNYDTALKKYFTENKKPKKYLNYNSYLKESCRSMTMDEKHNKNKYIGILAECGRAILTGMAVSDDWNVIVPIAMYCGTTWFFDKWSYYGMGGM